MAIPLLSVVIPAHNEESRLPRTLEQVFAFLDTQSYPSEVVVVENGSTDRTLELARGFAARHPNLKLIHTDGRGKGLAVRLGMLAASGEYAFMCDADLSMPIDQVSRFLPPALPGVQVAIGSREVKGARRFDEPAHRHIGGRFINLLIRLLILPRLQDTQCGFKCFSRSVARDLFQAQVLDGWSFDIELLYIAYRRGYTVVEVPVDWYYRSESKVSAVPDALRMISDIFRIRANGRRGLYDAPRANAAA